MEVGAEVKLLTYLFGCIACKCSVPITHAEEAITQKNQLCQIVRTSYRLGIDMNRYTWVIFRESRLKFLKALIYDVTLLFV